MSLLDILGNYYDSATNTYTKVPEQCKFDIQFMIKKMNNTAIEYVIKAFGTEKTFTVEHNWYKTDLLETCNKFIPNFILENNFKELVKCKLIFRDGYVHENVVKELNHLTIIEEWLSKKSSIPKTFTVTCEFFRINDDNLRMEASKKATGGKTPKEYFSQVLDVRFKQGANPTSKWGIRNAFANGSVKSQIFDHYTKEEGVFLAEYLYGVKIPKNAKYAECFIKLANQPYSDFGVRDVQVLKKLVNTVNLSVSPIKTTKLLLDLGIKPATNLSRWYKKNPGLEELIKTV